MATRGNEDNAALLVIDVQNGVVANAWQRDDVVENIGKMVEHARHSSVPVIWIQHEDEDLARDSEQWQLVADLVPEDSETRIYKQYSDSFANTDLSKILADLDVGHLVISGAQTNACVRATTYRAAAEGFDVTLVEDAHTTEDIDWDGVNLQAESMINDLNLTLKFIGWPGQDVTSVPTSAVLEM